jgi:hypothetical protein
MRSCVHVEMPEAKVVYVFCSNTLSISMDGSDRYIARVIVHMYYS